MIKIPDITSGCLTLGKLRIKTLILLFCGVLSVAMICSFKTGFGRHL